MKKLFNVFKRGPRPIYVVSGLPRSGTSMMMKMLEAGGVPLLVDHLRKPDEDNPKGYYEFERVKKLPDGDIAWVAEAQGKVVKIISYLLQHLPDGYPYRVIFMRRAMAEILASQRKMLDNRNENPDAISDEDMAALYEKHLAKTFAWLGGKQNFQVLEVDYNQLILDPAPFLPKIDAFIELPLNLERMSAVVDPNLYRQRTN